MAEISMVDFLTQFYVTTV